MKAIKFLGLALVIGVMSAFTLIKPAEGYKVGDIATDFSLKNVDNKKVSLKDFSAAKGFIVVFTCNHCPYAQAYEDRIVALDKKYKKLGYPVIAINPNNPAKQKDDSFELMQVRAKEKNFTFPYLLDEGQKIYPQYGATKTPHVYILQKNSLLIFFFVFTRVIRARMLVLFVGAHVVQHFKCEMKLETVV